MKSCPSDHLEQPTPEPRGSWDTVVADVPPSHPGKSVWDGTLNSAPSHDISREISLGHNWERSAGQNSAGGQAVIQAEVAMGAGVRPDVDDVVDMVGRGSEVSLMALLCPAPLALGPLLLRRLGRGHIRRWWLRGVAGVGLELGPQLEVLGLEGLELGLKGTELSAKLLIFGQSRLEHLSQDECWELVLWWRPFDLLSTICSAARVKGESLVDGGRRAARNIGSRRGLSRPRDLVHLLGRERLP